MVLLIASVALMTCDHGSNALAPLRNTLATAITPFQVMAQWPADAYAVLMSHTGRDELQNKERALQRRVLLLESKLAQLAALRAENQRLRNLLSSVPAAVDEVLVAEILSVNSGPYRHYLKLGKGSRDGVFVGQALMDGNGIVGQVIQVTPFSAAAIMITDSSHGTPVEFNRTGLQTIAHGTGQPSRLVLPFLPATADVRVGDLLVTSGLGGRFPIGYPVATVSNIERADGSQFLTVTAEPTASLNRGREVLLVWHERAGVSNEAAAAPITVDPNAHPQPAGYPR